MGPSTRFPSLLLVVVALVVIGYGVFKLYRFWEVAPVSPGNSPDREIHATVLPVASPLPAIAGALLGAERIHLYEDSVLVKEPGSIETTAFHQDLSYFHLAGDRICTTWVPIDPVTVETGAVAYLRQSHRSGLVHRPNWFVSDTPLPGTDGEPVPAIDDGDPRLVRFAVEPGDVVVHHAATLHGAGPNQSATARRRAISVRYCGDDVRYEIRPGAPTKAHHAEVRSGDPVVDHPGCPVVWERTVGSVQ